MEPLTSFFQNTKEFKVLSPLVRDPDVSVTDVVRSVLNLTVGYATHGNPGDPDAHAFELFGCLVDIVSQTPIPQQQKLLEFVLELQKHTVVDPATGEALKYRDYRGNFWTNLPHMGLCLREAWNFYPDHADASQRAKVSWENLSAFMAQLTASSPIGTDGDFPGFCLWAMRDAFEEAPISSPPKDIALRSACLWIIHAGDRILKHVENELDYETRPGDAYAENKWNGFNSERLELWKDCLKAAQTKYDGETKSMIDSALAKLGE